MDRTVGAKKVQGVAQMLIVTQDACAVMPVFAKTGVAMNGPARAIRCVTVIPVDVRKQVRASMTPIASVIDTAAQVNVSTPVLWTMTAPVLVNATNSIAAPNLKCVLRLQIATLGAYASVARVRIRALGEIVLVVWSVMWGLGSAKSRSSATAMMRVWAIESAWRVNVASPVRLGNVQAIECVAKMVGVPRAIDAMIQMNATRIVCASITPASMPVLLTVVCVRVIRCANSILDCAKNRPMDAIWIKTVTPTVFV